MRATRPAPGFTLIEILVVVTLIVLVMGLVVTNIDMGSSLALSGSGRVLAAELEYVSQRAIATGRPHRWAMDFDAQLFRVEQRDDPEGPPEATGAPIEPGRLDLAPPMPSEEFAPLDDDEQGQWRPLPYDDVAIDELVLGGEAVTDALTGVGFAPDGGADPAEIWLVDADGHELRIRIVGFTGEIEVAELERD